MPQCAAGEYPKSKFDANNCITGYECIASSAPTPTNICPQVPYPGGDFCRNGKSAPKYDSRGCVTGYDCIQFTQPSCPAAPSKPSCPSGSMPDPKFDPQGCIIDYGCRLAEGEACPQYYNPVCGSDGKTYSNDCHARSASVSIKRYGSCEEKPFCGNYRCEIGEDQGNCAKDCGHPIPQGCRGVKDENGFERYECEGEYKRACPSIPTDAEKRCSQNGGRFAKRTDHSGCDVTFCEFGEKTSFLQAPAACHSEREVKQISDKCASVGSPVQISVAGENCKIARCGQKEEQLCHDTSFEVRQDIEKKCSDQGLRVISSFDESGCQRLQCAAPQACQRDVPREAHDVCRRQGGELIVKHQDGCVSFVECVRRGDENEVYVDEVTEVPKPTELLSIALKLEELRVEFDKLARQTDAIADYYKSAGSGEEQRFRRVADMFDTAKNKVDEIRQELRSKLDSITTDDLVEVKHDIRYIKDVMMKDIVYFMLSNGEDVKELKSKDEKDCGSSEECFGRSFRVCKSAIFYPEGRRGPKVEITGLEGDSCVMKATMPEEFGPPAGSIKGINPPYEMTCKIKDYALGVNNPEEDIFPHCTGNMIELIKKYGTGPSRGEFKESEDFREQEFRRPSSREFERRDFRRQGEFQRQQPQAGFQQGIQAGVQQGIQSGIQQGIQQGVQQGVQQGIQGGLQQGITNPPALP